LQERALDRIGLFRREPAVAQSAALAGARPAHLRPIDPAALSRSLARLVKIAPPLDPPPEVMGRTITLADRAAVIRAAIRRADAVVLQDLLRDVRDKVVVAVTFLAMLELVKRREIVVEQSEPWGPIVARKISEAELAAAGVAAADENEAIDESLESFR
jgi:segregation and condensation protein A